ncbi:hypothetical protein [Pontibacter aydingkolensis]|uniref:hypothetical protein n=1 Tax=Pontibacter aydingkolensis TaxID=1911536 RepID=UPI001C627FD9|nr:hypothetical protein [Pontibacter aydingkolensis]
MTGEELPVEVEFLPGVAHESRFLKSLHLNFELEIRYSDIIFTNYLLEDMHEQEQIGWRVK